MWYGQFKLLDDCPNSKEKGEKRKPPPYSLCAAGLQFVAGTFPANTDVSSCCCSPGVGYCNSFPTGFVFFQLKEKSLLVTAYFFNCFILTHPI